ncbi:uncharacterized protein LOC135207263 [Macrobrachium nipponense]|uniref:uncharacterized protein LOC135207263 n=1 Tax=Macrobrachium nipponense TaxID=159736 RepID=UPI0030C7ACAE
MNFLKEGLATTLVLILLQGFVHVAEGGPVQPKPITGPSFSPLEKKDVSDDDITEHFNSKFFRDMVYTSYDLTALESLQKSSEFPSEALGDGEDAWEEAEAQSTLSGGESQEWVSSAPDKENKKDLIEKYISIVTPAAQRDAAETGNMVYTEAVKLPTDDKTAFFVSDESMKKGKKEKYIWIAIPDWTRSWKAAQRDLEATVPITAFSETAAQKEASSSVPSFIQFKEATGEEGNEGSPTDASDHKKDTYSWYAVPEKRGIQQATHQDSDVGTLTSDVTRHHRQKRFVTPYKLRLIAVPVSIFNYLGFLPIKIPGLPYHDELPPSDYTYYNTMHDLRTQERVKYFF